MDKYTLKILTYQENISLLKCITMEYYLPRWNVLSIASIFLKEEMY